MATVGNERYLRHIWLLGEGGLLVLRGIVTRETALSGQPLEHILASKRSAFNNILREQNLLLFPTSSTVNHDVSTWDSSLLLLVIKRIFWSRLSPADQSSIGILKTYRNCIQGHPKSLSMEINDYDTNRVVLEAALRQLASGLGANSTSEIEDIIQNSASGNIDIGSVLRRIKDLLEVETTLKSLENKIEHINSSLRDMAVSSERDFRETKDEQQRMLQIVSDMAKLNRRYILDQTKRQKSKDLETIVQAHCSNKEKEKKAIELLYSVVEIIQGASTFSEFEIKAMIAQRIKWHDELTPTLIEEVIGWFKDINDNPDTSVGKARLGSIRLPIKCSSVGGLLRHFDYMNGGESQRRLLDISKKLIQLLGFSCNLSWSVVPESVLDVTQALYKLTEPSKLVLPFKTSVKGLQNIWKMFGGEDKNTHLLNISQTLSKMFEENILLTAAVEKDQFQTALLEMELMKRDVGLTRSQLCGIETELEIDDKTSKYTPVIPEIGIQPETVDKTHKYTPGIPRRTFPEHEPDMAFYEVSRFSGNTPTMATVGNERYLRHIWLLGDGGLLVLRGIVSREASTCGQPFETFLDGKRSQFNNLLDAQRLKLFPDHSTVNTDTKTWDMSLLITVVRKTFWANLPAADKSYIKTLKTHRDELKAHPNCMSMSATDYSNSTQLLKTALCKLASGLSADTKSQLQNIIKCAESETIDIKSALQHITELNEFKETFLQELEKSLLQVTTEIQKMHSSVNNLKDDIATIGKDQLVCHHQLSAGMQELTVAAKKSQEDISELKDLQERQNVMTKKILRFIKKKAVEKAKRATVKELQIIIQMDCEDQEKREKATDLLFGTVRLIQNEDNFSEEEVRTMINQRIEWRGELGAQLIEDVIEWFTDIDEVPDSSLGFAYKGSIRIPIQCFSKYSIYTQIYYMSSNKCLRRLSGISSTLTKLLGFSCFITCSEASNPLTNVLKEQGKTSESKTIVLPFQCKSDHGLADIQKTLGKKNKHTMKMSKTLSDIFDAKITLNTFIERDKLPRSMYKSTMSLPSYESKKMMDSSHSLLDLEGMQLVSFESKKMMASSTAHLDKELYASNFGDRPDSLLPRSLPWQSPSLSASASLQMRETEGKQETSLQLVGTYSIVRDKTDVYAPHIFAFEIIPQEGVIIIDRFNKKLKKLDKGFKTVSVYDLSKTPWDVCYIGEGKVAVSLEFSGILFADVSGIIKMEKVVLLNIFCGGLAFFGNILYIGDTRSRIYTYTSGDTQPRFLYQKAQGIHSTIWRLAVSQSGEKIYMVCLSGITTINADGRQLATLQYDESCNSPDICVIDDGTILVSDLHSPNVIQINSEGTKVLRTFTLQNITPFTMCYDKQVSRLIVGDCGSDVHVYKLPAM